ncbi:DUF2264 domain-containing protein [Oryzifoliimicrobium ureilyticus]|uniref:DUF2264 domain-containing protein n=1 Tax=Oryzifoliimicrobium ureilyticus TaxID=3113724 RepID=UPI0030761F5F
MTFDAATANPLFGNMMQTREQMAKGLLDLFDPLLPFFSNGNARVRLDAVGAHFDRAAADLEGFARPLWGLAPFAAGGGRFAHWDRYAEGIANGTDPKHPEYWGSVNGRDQRMVELAALGFALALVPERLWDPLKGEARDRLIAYLKHARQFDYAENNWKFFRILVDIALDRLGVDFDRSLTKAYLAELDGFYIADGWYRDGNIRRIDHYVPFAMHFYGLIYARLVDDDHGQRYRERARLFARDFSTWFAEDGAVVPFGRSLTYRFACAGFWSALAFAGEEALPWGEVKGLTLRHIRWWSRQPIANSDGVLSIGYAYPQLTMSESYNSAGSPYWAFKAFLPLALEEEHPFWTAPEASLPQAPIHHPLPHPGMIMMRSGQDVVALSSGQENLQMRCGPEKYAKFAYSAHYGFSIEVDERGFATGAFDSMLSLSDDRIHYRVRETNEDAQIAGDAVYAKWHPWPEVTIETWLVAAAPWHLRIHRIKTPRSLKCIEGGFAIAKRDGDLDHSTSANRSASALGEFDFSGIVDIGSSVPREGFVQKPLPNTNLMVSKTLVPQLRADIPAGQTILCAAVMAVRGGSFDDGWNNPPDAPTLADLERRFAETGTRVSAIEAPGSIK